MLRTVEPELGAFERDVEQVAEVLAGPAPKRTLQALQDPCLKATQDAWPAEGIDSRLPFIPRHPTA